LSKSQQQHYNAKVLKKKKERKKDFPREYVMQGEIKHAKTMCIVAA